MNVAPPTSANVPLVSFIVPVYNAEKYLTECLDSIIGQTYNNLQIICVNDGSKDSSGEILFKYAERDKRIEIIDKRNTVKQRRRNRS